MVESLQENKVFTIFNSTNLSFNPKKLRGKYGCMAIFENQTSKQELRYKLIIDFLKKIDNQTNLFRITRLPEFYINDRMPEDSLSLLAFEVSNLLYPVEFEVNSNGLLKKIANYDEIVNRWQENENIIRDKYNDEFVNNYLRKASKKILNESILFNKIKKDWFFTLYFSPIYRLYDENLVAQEFIDYPIAGKAAHVKYATKLKLDYFDNEQSNYFILKLNGKISDNRCALDLEQQLDFPYYVHLNSEEKELEGNNNVTYLLNKDTGIIEGIEAEITAEFINPKKVTIKMFLLENLLDEKEHTGESASQTDNNSFWKKLFKK